MRGVIHDFNVVLPNAAKIGALPNSTVAVQAQDAIKRALVAQAWAWFDAHQNDAILTIKVWIISKTIRWRDVRVGFERLFGSRPLD